MKSVKFLAIALIAGSTAYSAGTVDAQVPGPESRSAEALQRSQGKNSLPYLGITVESVPPEIFRQLSELLGNEQGLVVKYVAPGSPAANAGIQLHDVVVTLDNQRLFSVEQLLKLVHADRVGRMVALGIVRDGKKQTVEVMLGERSKQHQRLAGVTPRMQSRRKEMPIHHASPTVGSVARARPNPAKANWQHFSSMNLEKTGQGRFKLTFKHLDQTGTVKQHDYQGTRDEISQAIQNDTSLPNDALTFFPPAIGPPGTPDMVSGLPPLTQSYVGYVETAGDGQISIQTISGDVMTFDVAPQAKIVVDGKAATLKDLKAVDIATVHEEDSVATRIDARSAHLDI